MAALAGAVVLNIGTLSSRWIDAMLLAGRSANEHGVPVVLDPVGVGATQYRTETARRILDEVDVAVLRGNAGEVATLAGIAAEMRGVESIGAGADPAELARIAARSLGVVASVTGPVDHVSDGEQIVAIANGHPLLASVTGTGCMSSAVTGCFLAVEACAPRRRGRCARRVRRGGEDAAQDAKGPGSFHVTSTTRSRRSIPGRSTTGRGAREAARDRADLETARRAIMAGATVVQLRLKASTDEVVARGAGFRRSARRSSSTTTSTQRSSSAPTVSISASPTAAPPAPRAGLLLGRSATSSSTRSRPMRTTSASARSGRRRRSSTPIRRSASPASPDLRRGLRPGGRDRRHRRRECRRVHRGGRRRRRGRPRGNRSGSAAGGG